jgi:Lrp/AsnC family transcriptional regulator
MQLDDTDRKILRILQCDAGRPTAQIAEEVGLSQAPCWRRIQRLKEHGFIRAHVALLDRRKVGLNTQIFALIKLTATGRSNVDAFTETVKSFPEVLDCYVMMGAVDFILRIVAPDIDAYERFFFDRLSRLPGVQDINSMVALSEIKSTTELPLV